MISAYLWVALGGALGSVLRFAVSEWMGLRYGSAFPWGTMAVNVVGSLLIGLLAAMAVPEGVRLLSQTPARAFLIVGLCGGFTTFSTFSLQTLVLMQGGQWAAAGANVVASVVLCLAAVAAGYWGGDWLVNR